MVQNGSRMSNKMYDRVKFVVQILLPAIGTLYFSLGNIWSFPNIEQVIGSISSVNVFLGVLVGISSSVYNGRPNVYNGELQIETGDDGAISPKLVLEATIEELSSAESVVFKVTH